MVQLEFTSDTIWSTIAIAISLWGIWYSKRALEQSNKLTNIQLTYEGRKQALSKLMEIMNKKIKGVEWHEILREFMDSDEAILLPPTIIREVNNQIAKLKKFEDDNAPWDKPPEMSDEDTDEAFAEYYASLDPVEQYDHDLNNEASFAKTSILRAISKELNNPVKEE